MSAFVPRAAEIHAAASDFLIERLASRVPSIG
jgi:hypothetical protein